MKLTKPFHFKAEKSEINTENWIAPKSGTKPTDLFICPFVDGVLGQFQPGEWAPWEPCDMLTGKQKRERYCQSVPPLYTGINSSFQLNESKSCGTF